MKKKLIHILLLYSLFFNIAHATVLATEDSCQHESVHTYVLEQSQASNCGDLCELHHLFHFMAIITNINIHFSTPMMRDVVKTKLTQYTPPFQETSIKPPIA